jgi:hypothetical protein
MTYEEVLRAFDQPSEQERLRLRQHLNKMVISNSELDLKAGTMNIDMLLAAIADLRRGLTESDIDEIVAAMNKSSLE